jgi:predicted SAM-dependent methyltransferase
MKKTLNVGAGERQFEFYPTKNYKCINFDARDVDGIDITGDATDLPFDNEEFEYILASDIIEHFPISKTVSVLKEWMRVLKSGGIIEFRLPNLKAIANAYLTGVRDCKTTSWLLYGGQEYEGNFHYVGFDRQFFKATCAKVGLMEITYTEDGFNMIVRMRKNG